jgi:hypothetical protein
MGWQDSLSYLGSLPPLTPRSNVGGLTSLSGMSSLASASGGLRPLFGGGSAGGGGVAGATGTPYTKAQPPESFQFSLPFSTNPQAAVGYQPAAIDSTEGDFFASMGAAISDAIGGGGNLNLGNLIPRLLEAPGVFATSLADNILGVENPLAQAFHVPFDAYSNALTAYSDLTAPLFNALPEWYKNSQLGDRAKVYRAIAQGRQYDFGPLGLGSFFMTRSLLNPVAGPAAVTGTPIASGGAADQAQAWNAIWAEIHDRISPGSTDADAQLALLKSVIDLPASVKRLIDANPDLSDADIEKLLDTAPEGRQWSYAEGATGFLRNVATPAVIYGGEMIAAFRLGGALSTQVGNAGFASGIPAISEAAAFAARIPSLAGKIQTRLAAVGVGTLALTTVADGIARSQGNQAVLDFANTVFNQHPISDDPHVQLMTSFIVNPLASVGLLKRGTLRLAYGAGDITFGRALGTKMSRLITSDEFLFTRIAQLYRTDVPTAKSFVGEWFESRGEMADHLIELATQDVMKRLPIEERIRIQGAYANPIERVKYVLSAYKNEIWNTVEKHPERMSDALQYDFATYADVRGGFDMAGMLRKGLDYRRFKEMTYRLRQETETVVGYVDTLHPRAIEDIRIGMERYAPDAPVPNAVIADYQVSYPAFSKYVGESVLRPGATLTRTEVDRALALAEDDWARISRQNPVRASTGVDPVLRPGATPDEWATALGTTPEVLDAIDAGLTPDLIRPYLIDRAGIDPAVVSAMAPDDVIARAQAYTSDVSAPWVARGRQIAAAEEAMSGLRSEYAAIKAREAAGERIPEAEYASQARRMSELQELANTAAEPIIPYSARVRFAEREIRTTASRRHYQEQARRKVAAQNALDELAGINDEALILLPGKSRWRDYIAVTPSGAWGWTGGLPEVSASLLGKIESYLRGYGKAGLANSLHEVGTERVWQAITDHYHHGSPFWKSLTASQRKQIENVMAQGGKVKSTLDEAAGAWRSKSGEIKGPQAYGTEDDFLAELGGLAARYDELLDGTSPYQVRRAAALEVPATVLDEVLTGERSLVHDPMFDAIEHPRNLGQLQAALAQVDAFDAVAPIIERDPILLNGARVLARESGESVTDFVANPSNAGRLATLIPDGFDPAATIGNRPRTPLDQAIIRNAPEEVDALMDELGLVQGRYKPPPPVAGVPIETAERLMRGPEAVRPSTSFERSLDASGVDPLMPPNAAILADPSFAVGKQVLSILNHGKSGTEPTTLQSVIALLREIENGNAANLGMGDDLLAQGQRLAYRLLEHEIHRAQRLGIVPGFLGPGLDPRTMDPGTFQYIKDLADDRIIAYDPTDPSGVQYGIKKPPKDAVTLEFEEARRIANESGVPGLGEEFLMGNFKPFEQRIGSAQIRQAYNYLFGPHHNLDIERRAQAIFTERSQAVGVLPEDAVAIWKAWRQTAQDSRQAVINRMHRATGKKITVEKGDNPLYAGPRNIPNPTLEEVARTTLRDRYAEGGLPRAYDAVEFHQLFRQSTSQILRSFTDSGLPMTDVLGKLYGSVTGNRFVTTTYYWFRFGLDARFHAMNYLEPFFLYTGRAGLIPGSPQGVWGPWTENTLRALSRDALNDTGYPFGMGRVRWAYKAFAKQQRPGLLREIKGMQAEDPALMTKALTELAEFDPELSQTIRAMGDTPDAWLEATGKWYSKVMDSADPEGVIAGSFDDAVRAEPHMAEIYGRLNDVNQELWSDLRSVFYGKADRSRMERTLNSYLLYWPLSYQLKASRWLFRVLFESAGGLPTNAAGAYALNGMIDAHNRQLQADPGYAAWFEKHKTLMFAAQMLLPISWDSIGVTLSPPLRNLFFDRSKQIMKIGPVYTLTDLVPRIAGELYPDISGLPGVGWAYRSLVGKPEPEGAPAFDFGLELDPTRPFGA